MVKSCEVIKDISKKSGNEYIAIDITFVNGYKVRYFPKAADLFIIKQLLESDERR